MAVFDLKSKFNWKILVVGAASVGYLVLRHYVLSKRAFCNSTALLRGKTALITGANTGLGKATAVELGKRDATVILACRDLEHGEKAAVDIRKQCRGHGEFVVKRLDLASLASIRKFSADINREGVAIDILINNAGVAFSPFTKTEDGFELQMGVNHLGHFLLTNLLLNSLNKCDGFARVVIVSSSLHKKGVIDIENLNSQHSYDKRQAYANSKLANVLFARELDRSMWKSNIRVFCLHPGIVQTDLGRHVLPKFLRYVLFPLQPLIRLLLLSPEEGCQTIVHCAVAPELENLPGYYYGSCRREPWTEVSWDTETARRLWEISAELTGFHSQQK